MSEDSTKPIKLHRDAKNDPVLSLGNAEHPYLKLPPRYEQTTMLGVNITSKSKPKVYGIKEGTEYVGKAGWVSIVYAFPLSEVGIDTETTEENEDKPFEEEEE
jgi:hypothetical protein